MVKAIAAISPVYSIRTSSGGGVDMPSWSAPIPG